MSATVVTGVPGDDVHVIGIRLIEHALRAAGHRVTGLGVMVSHKDFIEAAIESAADAIFLSSLNGHAQLWVRGLREACVEAGIGDILLYAGGQLTIGRPDWAEVERLFVTEMGLDRIFPSTVTPAEAVTVLEEDLQARHAAGRTT